MATHKAMVARKMSWLINPHVDLCSNNKITKEAKRKRENVASEYREFKIIIGIKNKIV